MKRILAVGAHPDDIEFGCGGTLIKASKSGAYVHGYIMTMPKNTNRIEEQSRSFDVLGVKWELGTVPETNFNVYSETIGDIEKLIKEVSIDTVFVHYPKDTHQDHFATARTVLAAARNVPNVLFYEGPTTLNFSPKVFVDILDSIKKKIGLLSCHESQINKTNITGRNLLEMAEANAISCGIIARTGYAEGFVPVRTFIFNN